MWLSALRDEIAGAAHAYYVRILRKLTISEIARLRPVAAL
jgi:hypothetical protein